MVFILEATGSYYSATSYLTTRSKEFAAYLYKEDGSYQQLGEDKDQGNSGNKDQRYRITFLKGAVGYDHSFGKHRVAALFVADLNQIQDQNVQKGYLRNYTNYSGRMNYNYDDRYLAELYILAVDITGWLRATVGPITGVWELHGTDIMNHL